MSNNKVTKEMVAANMQDYKVTTLNFDGKPTTVVQIRMKNGFIITDSTSCVDPANYSEEIGKQILLKRMENKVWELLGFELASKLNGSALSLDNEMSFAEVYPFLKQGKKIKRKDWHGYWQLEDNKVLIHCKDGRILDMNGQMDDTIFTLDNIVSNDWIVIPDNE